MRAPASTQHSTLFTTSPAKTGLHLGSVSRTFPGLHAAVLPAHLLNAAAPPQAWMLGRALSSAAESWDDAAAILLRVLADLGLSTAPARSVSRSADQVLALKPDIDRRRAEILNTDQQQIVQTAAKTIQGILPKSPGVKEAIGSLWGTYAHRYLPGVWEGTKDIGLSGLAMIPFIAPF